MVRIRRSAIAGLVVAGAVLTGPGAGTAGPPIGTCPTSEWELRAAPTSAKGAPGADVNGNGLSCYLEAPEGSGIHTIIDDVARSPHAP